MSKVQDRTVKIGAYEFVESEHLHKLDGKPLTGVTTILGVIAKPMLIQWAANQAVEYITANSEKEIVAEHPETKEKVWTGNWIVKDEALKEAKVAHRKKKESAGEFGTNVHNAIEQWIKTKEVWLSKDEMEQKAFNHFVKWAEDNKVKFLDSEKHVYSRSGWYGGIMDILLVKDGKTYVADIKTSSGIYEDAFFQMAAYQNALIEMGYTEKIDGAIVINLTKRGTIEVQENYDYEGNLKAFLAALTIYRQKAAISGK